MLPFPFGYILRKGKTLLTALRCPSLGNILNLLIAEVSHIISNLPKKIFQMQQPIIDLYIAQSSSVHRGESSNSGWCLSESSLVHRGESFTSG
jgi:hypothetical protein